MTLAVGEHVRMPRLYRGRDIQWWLEAVGVLDERYDEVDDIVRARRVPSPQLVGSPERRTLDLNALLAQGVDVVGRLVGVDDGTAAVLGSLAQPLRAGRPEARPVARPHRRVGAERASATMRRRRRERFAATRVAASCRASRST